MAEALNSGARVYVNGEIIGHHEDPQTLVENLRRLRRSGSLSSQMNVAYFEDTNEIFMNTDSGRARRPLIQHRKRSPDKLSAPEPYLCGFVRAATSS